MTQVSPVFVPATLLVASNVFMTFAWYAHLKNLATWPWWVAASWPAVAVNAATSAASNATEITSPPKPSRRLLITYLPFTS